MNTREAYNQWAEQYDTNRNRTRDMEAVVLRETLGSLTFDRVLEIGCGTGKNTEWLVQHAQHVTAIDLSEEMLACAREKVTTDKVTFKQADITQPWSAFSDGQYDLVTFSLVLEHIEHLSAIWKEVAAALKPGGHVYIGELHPYKQYTGTKARFDTPTGRHEVPCFTHHISDFSHLPTLFGLQLVSVNEWFDDGDRDGVPRVLGVVLCKALVEV